MKLILYIVAVSLFIASCNTSQTAHSQKTIECHIEGMTCDGCEMTIKSKLEQNDAISVTEIDHTTGIAKLSISKDIAPIEDIKNTISDAGYTCTSVKEVETIEDKKDTEQ